MGVNLLPIAESATNDSHKLEGPWLDQLTVSKKQRTNTKKTWNGKKTVKKFKQQLQSLANRGSDFNNQRNHLRTLVDRSWRAQDRHQQQQELQQRSLVIQQRTNERWTFGSSSCITNFSVPVLATC